jgi:GT2 family glycosyltransferase
MIKGKVIVQLLVYSEPVEMIDRLFASLEKVKYPKELWEVAVLNNFCVGHEDLRTLVVGKWLPRAEAQGWKIHFFEKNPNLGFAGGHEFLYREVAKLEPEFVYLLNGDASVDPHFLAEAVTFADEHPNAAIMQSRIMLQQEPELLNSSGNAMQFLGFGFSLGYRVKADADGQPVGQTKLPMFYPSGAGVLFRVAVLENIGGLFDPRYFLYHEDSDVGWRAIIAGHEVMYAPKSVIFHHYEFSKSIKKFYWIERNRFVNLFVFYRMSTLLLIMPALVLMEFGTLLFAVKSGWWKEKLRMWGFFWKPSTWRWIMQRRRFVQKIRVRSDRDMLGYMDGAVTNQEVENPLMTYVANPFLRGYFYVLKKLVRW